LRQPTEDLINQYCWNFFKQKASLRFVATGAVPKTGADWARGAYEGTALAYDDFTAHHRDDEWIADLLVVLKCHGLKGNRLFDVGCGTGKSFVPMLPRGWEVTGCDISPSMLELAREKVNEGVRLEIADMLALPRFGAFDLVWALDDTINYLLRIEELEQALGGMRENLATTGLLLFDVNTLLAYRTFYAETTVVERQGRRLVWRGLMTPDVASGSICESCLEVMSGERVGSAGSTAITHRQRHFPQGEVLATLERAGLECLGVYGINTDGIRKQPLDESIHTKAIYIARRTQSQGRTQRPR
jgi:SAM-dependent methyltransferase